jgi:hypothetical protein
LSANTKTPAEYQVPAVAAEEVAVDADGWPDELVERLRLHTGVPRRLLPLNALLTSTEIRSERSMMLNVWEGLTADDPEMAQGDPSLQQAGAPAYRLLPEYIPFAGLDGYFWFIDTRSGPMRGCITEYSRDTADDGGPKWHSLSSMLSDLADSLETGAAFDRTWLPHIIDNQLDWQIRP